MKNINRFDNKCRKHGYWETYYYPCFTTESKKPLSQGLYIHGEEHGLWLFFCGKNFEMSDKIYSIK